MLATRDKATMPPHDNKGKKAPILSIENKAVEARTTLKASARLRTRSALERKRPSNILPLLMMMSYGPK